MTSSMRWLLAVAVVLSCSVSWSSSRRHFGQRTSDHRTRHRRQGARLFHPGSYIVPQGEGYGAWGPWGDPSSCSRTCGGGVAHQTRICLDYDAATNRSSCVGGDKKYFSCNTQDCPDNAVDFRSEQCAAYNNVPFQDITYNWVPYMKAEEPCQLTCMPRGERFYIRHKTMVVDGTPCGSDGPDVCVEGDCHPVGCDLMLGSSAQEDKCRVCRGNGTSCQTISDVNREELRQGYNDILWIPARATSISISELRPSFNYLAIRSVRDGKYYLNGDYRLLNPSKYEFAGAVWHYERSHTLAAADSIRCQGPTTEPVYLSLLVTSENVGVKYEYSIPNGILPNPGQQYSWSYDSFTPCSLSCGGGYQTRNVTCISNDDVKTVDENLCDPGQRPPENQTCNEVACPARWVEGPWGPCSQPCGTGGSQSRQVYCEKVISHGLPSVVSDEECSGTLGPKPELHRRCNEGDNCPKWHTGPWKPCSKLCGEGRQTRQVVCYIQHGSKIEVLGDEECADARPPVEQRCMLHPCDGVDWVTSDWKGCDTCLSKLRTRTAHCTTLTERVEDKFCAHHKPPVLEEKCVELPDCKKQWYASEWSKCSAQCGEGVQQRIVFCGQLDKDENTVEVIGESDCDSSTKYNNTKPCVTDSEDCPASWHTGPWSTCTEECGTGGMQYRRVLCMRGNKTTDSISDCSGDPPTQSLECNRKSCDADETIPVTVGSTQVMDEDDYDEDCDDDYPEENADIDSSTPTDEEMTSTTEEPDTSMIDEELMVSDGPYSSSSSDLFTELGSGETSSSVSESTEITFGSGDGELAGSTSEISSESTTQSSYTPTEATVGTDASTDSSNDDSSSTTDDSSASTADVFGSSTDSTAGTGSTVTETAFTGTDASTEISTETSGETASTTEGETASTTDGDTESTTAPTSTESTTLTGVSTESTTGTGSTEPPTDEPTGSSEGSTESSGTEQSTTDSSTESESSTTESGSTTVGSTDGTAESSSTAESGTDSTVTEGTTLTEISTESTGETGSTGTEPTSTESTAGSTESTGTEETGTEGTGTEATASTTEGSTESSTTEAISESGSTESVQTESGTTDSSFSWATTILQEATRRMRKCRPRRSKCADTQFGCCYDNVTAAAGPFDAGCPMPESCDKTPHGCCPDGVSPASGARSKGCPPSHCEETLFGCCKSDNSTPAQGNEQEGCPPPAPACKKSKYGCCKDEKMEAKGPKGKGCPENAPKPKPCGATKFGCCYDNVTKATGAKGKGCPCHATEFGCCPDRNSTATGPHYQGCVMECSSSAFGCCPDGETPAHGPMGEGCCLATSFGCCHDNINAARGPNFEGCDCKYSPYRCCPDNVTSARGPDNAGCGCDVTTHGCCPDGHDTALGANFEGCPCHTHQFGCCPDGVTAATGLQGRGCRCADTQYGCCGDEQTPASGPEGAGCDCSSSKYGCCPDGTTSATGEKFLGCTDVPKNLQEGCGLDKDQGVGTNFQVRWFYDTDYGGCSRFWYSGSEGNANRFSTQRECQDLCMHPGGKAVCRLPKIKGPCTSYVPMWYYDTERETCEQFIHGGCLGNDNKFKSREDCQTLCEVPRDSDICNAEVEPGSCAGNFVRWGFDKASKRCTQFVWGGCEGNGNRFTTEAACLQKCDTPGTLKEECRLNAEVGNCTHKIPKWRFDTRENRCVPFYYTGCGGNENRYESETECRERCPEVFVQDACSLEPQTGECYDYRLRWFFNVAEKRCSQFHWGGCGGNDNNFASEAECERRCTQRPTTTTSTTTSVAPQAPEPFRDAFCFLAADSGPCAEAERRFHYDSRAGACREFTYGGCGGNQNNFPTVEHCQAYCGAIQDTCKQPMLVGRCDESVMQWYYDAGSDSCSQFTYSGCEGNNNRFNSREECESRCMSGRADVLTTTTLAPVQPTLGEECRAPQSLEPCGVERPAWYYDERRGGCTYSAAGACGHLGLYQSEEACERQCGVFRSLEVCEYPLDPGPCRAAIAKIYFDKETGHCLDFLYGGCGGGPNRFSTVEECESICASVKRPEPEPGAGENEVSDGCEEYRNDCERIRCDYGVDRRKTAQGCQECVCRHPCTTIVCPDGQRCALQPLYAAGGERKFQPVCRLSTKPGVCPNTTSSDAIQCDRYCNDDADCGGEDKCCSRGCSFDCQHPEREDMTTPWYPRRYHSSTPYTPALDSRINAERPTEGSEEPAAPQVNNVKTPSEVATEEGGLATLYCVFNGYPAPTITWQRGALTIDGSTGRYRILTDGALQIVSVYRNDSGVYICIGDNPLGQVRKQVTLQVRDPIESPAAILGEENASITGVLHRPLLLRCSAYGYPPPEVYWWKGSVMLPFESQSYEINKEGLTIKSLEIEQLGEYTCQAFNGNDKPASWSVTVRAARPAGDSVYSPWLVTERVAVATLPQTSPPTRPDVDPYIMPYKPPIYNVPARTSIETDRTTFAVGSELTLPCFAEGLPPPTVFWTKDSEVIEQSARVHVSDSNRLTISGVTADDSGTYTCHASNDYSSHSSYVTVNVEGQYVHPNCTDNPFFANCSLIVKAKYCRHQYYAKFCCRSCTLDGQLSLQEMMSDQPHFRTWRK